MIFDILTKKKTKFKFLCANHEACPIVKNILSDMGFENLKDLNNSASFDISAKYHTNGREDIDKITQEIFKKTGTKITSIQIN